VTIEKSSSHTVWCLFGTFNTLYHSNNCEVGFFKRSEQNALRGMNEKLAWEEKLAPVLVRSALVLVTFFDLRRKMCQLNFRADFGEIYA
jgi:hypothetical protein